MKATQRAVIVLRDTEDGTFTADLSFEPSVKSRTETTPAIRAAWRIATLIVEQKEALIAPIADTKSADTPRIIITDSDRRDSVAEFLEGNRS